MQHFLWLRGKKEKEKYSTNIDTPKLYFFGEVFTLLDIQLDKQFVVE